MKAQQNSQYLTEQLGLDAEQQKKLVAPMKSATEQHLKLQNAMKNGADEHRNTTQTGGKSFADAAQTAAKPHTDGTATAVKAPVDAAQGEKAQKENALAVDAVVKELNQAISDILKGDQKQKFAQIKDTWNTKFKN